MKDYIGNCHECGGKLIISNKIASRDWTHPYRMKLRVRHEQCSKCRNNYLGCSAMMHYSYQQGLYRGKLLLKTYPLDSGKWINVDEVIPMLFDTSWNTKLEFFDHLNTCVFYCVVNHKTYVFRPSFEQYCRIKHGHFWIGPDYDGFYTEGDDINNTIQIRSVRNIHDFHLDIFIQGKWKTADLSFLSSRMTSEEFTSLYKYHGYGGLIWKTKVTLSNRKIVDSII